MSPAAYTRWLFRRQVIRACTRKTNAPGTGLRRNEPGETPLSSAEIWFGAQRGLIPVPPFVEGRRLP